MKDQHEPRDKYDEVLDLPKSLESEQGVLGGIMLSNSVLDRIGGKLQPEHFFDPFHRRLFECMQRLQESSRLITPSSLITFLGNYDLGEGVTVSQYLARLAANGFLPSETEDAAKTVSGEWAKRRIIELMNYVKGVAYDAPIEMPPSQIASQAIDELDAIIQTSDTHNYRMSVGQALQSSIDVIQKRLAGGEDPGTKTGLKALDDKMGPMRKGSLIILAGRPGMGKSAVALEIALNCAARGEVVPIFSLEMPAEETANRMASSWMLRTNQKPVPYSSLSDPSKLSEAELERVIMAHREIEKLPIEIDGQPALSLSQIAARARRYKQRADKAGMRLGAVIVDHIGIMASPRGIPNREREVAMITAGLKALAKEIDAPIIALCQLSRRVEERKISDRVPQMADLRESGAIEQDADVVLGVFRKYYYLAQLPAPSDAEIEEARLCENKLQITLLKNRHGIAHTHAEFKCFIGSNRIIGRYEDLQSVMALEHEGAPY